MGCKVSAKQQAKWEHEALERKFAKLQADYDKLKAKDVAPKPGETREIEGERAYPIYWLEAGWSCDGEQRDDYGGNHDGLPAGRIWNGTGCCRMFKEPQSRQQLMVCLNALWTANAVEKAAEKGKWGNPAPCLLSYRFERWETWCGGWFSHHTFDTGQTDSEALASFKRFVWRMERLNDEETTYETFTGSDGKEHTIPHAPYCLMGAEDRWRWCGSEDGSPDKRTDPPCRCKFCKEQGVIRIGH